MVIDILRQEHRNIETLLLILERELGVFARGERPDYEVVHAVVAYFQVYPDAYHHPLEDRVFEKLKVRDSAAASKISPTPIVPCVTFDASPTNSMANRSARWSVTPAINPALPVLGPPANGRTPWSRCQMSKPNRTASR